MPFPRYCMTVYDIHDIESSETPYCVEQVQDCRPVYVAVCATGLVCLLIFRGLAGIPYGPIWDWELYISAVDYRHILLGKIILVSDVHWYIT